MTVLHNQWAVDVHWFSWVKTSTAGEHYRKAGNEAWTIPLKACLRVADLKWSSQSGARAVLSEVDNKRLHQAWVNETK